MDRALDRGTRGGHRALAQFGDEVREARVRAGLSQTDLGRTVRLSTPQISRIERAQLRHLSILDASRIASVLGLDLSVRAYPGGSPLRDSAHAERLRRVVSHVRRPLTYRVDVPLPQRPEQPTELRAWDLVLYADGRRTGMELEMRIRDIQAMIRRLALKRRDDPLDGFVLILADTRTNRRAFAESVDLFPGLPRLRISRVLAALAAGQHPPSGTIFV